MKEELLLVLTGSAAGLFGAVLGVGGGVVVVPVLHLPFGLPLPEAIGTSLTVITGTALTSTTGFLRRGLSEMDLAVALGLGAVAGAVVVGFAAPVVPEGVLAVLFATLLVTVALRMAWKLRRPEPERSPKPSGASAAGDPRKLWAAYFLSPLVGAVAALLGIGGGLIQVPLLWAVVGLDVRRAVATTTPVVGWITSIAAILYLGRGQVDLPLVPWLLVGIIAGSAAAPAVLVRLPRRLIELPLCLLLLYAAVQMVSR